MQNNRFSTNKTWNLNGRIFDLSMPKIMGILNVTPDSFYDGKRYNNLTNALERAEQLIEEGVDIIDVGGYSSRPGAEDISPGEETSRVVEIIEGITKRFPTPVSIDTFRSAVASSAASSGASIINDITGGGHDPAIVETAIQNKMPFVVMHTRGTPKNMTQLTNYSDVSKEVIDALQHKVFQFSSRGLIDMAVDPGFGFAKTVDQNFEMLNNLETFRILGKPLLVGLSRKSMIWKTLETNPEGALNGTTALNMVALMKGATILRVHDVKEAVQSVKLFGKL